MRYFLSLLLLLLPAMAGADQTQDIIISHAWIRETPPGVSPMAGYMKISNNSSETVILQGVNSRDFERVELHRTRIEGDVARMERKDELTLSPGQTIQLKPGDYHLMLFGPTRTLHTGDRIPLTLMFKDMGGWTVEAEIRKDDGEAENHHHYHH